MSEVAVIFWLLACADPQNKPQNPEVEDSGEPEPEPEPEWSAEPCARAWAGPPGEGGALELSALHATARFFSDRPTASEVDAALVAILEEEGALDLPDLETYAQSLGACHLEADPAGLPEAAMEQREEVAWIWPGSGALSLPEGVTAVVVDLRGLPEAPGVESALSEAVGLALATEQSWPAMVQHHWTGHVDQYFSRTNVYETVLGQSAPEPLPLLAEADLPLIFVTGERVAPSAARLALHLRQRQRAWIVGADLPAQLGELRWSAVGEVGLALRVGELVDEGGELLPDVVPADLSTSSPEEALAEVEGWGEPAALSGEAARLVLERRVPWSESPPLGDGLGTERAALIAAHGTLRLFFPYFEDIGDPLGEGLDARLLELLPELPAEGRCDMRRKVGRLGNALSDGHMFFADQRLSGGCADEVAGYLPVWFDHLDGEAVVGHSGAEGIDPGDVLVAVDGVPWADLHADWLTWHGGATPGYRDSLADRELAPMWTPTTTYTLRDPLGEERDVTVDAAPVEDWYALTWAPSDRANGWLDDLGAPDVAYVNLDATVTTSDAAWQSFVSEVLAAGPAGLVVDMRGYPGVNHYNVIRNLITEDASSPLFWTPVLEGPDRRSVLEESYVSAPSDTLVYSGPLALLLSPSSVSAAENFSIMLAAARPDLMIVGRPSAGTNGNITGVDLPGEYALTFTGMELLWPDGSPFHGIGLLPDVEVETSPSDYRDGRDPDLEAAILALTGG